MSLDAGEVMAAALTWVYVPPGTPEVRTDEFHLLAYPPTWHNPTQVTSIDSARSADGLVDDVLAAATGLGRTGVTFWTHPRTRPADLVEHLLARGATLEEDLAVLARPLTGRTDLPDLAVPPGLEIRPALDLATMRDHDSLTVAVFGGAPTTDADLVADVDRVDETTGLTFVGYRDGAPVSSAGVTLRDGVARLWGGCTLPEARHTGAYRALLEHRLRLGAEAGCEMALVKGRLETSAPILARAGFEQYGEERSYRLGA